jgi:hypothetical protein
MNAIETAYKGATFRSRLEARWAAFFDLLSWDWIYEPWDGNHYIPDFVLPGPRPVLVEVKPATSLHELERHAGRVENGIRDHWTDDYLLVGATPVLPGSSGFGPTLGWLGESNWTEPWGPGPSEWVGCAPCADSGIAKPYRFIHTFHSYAGRPCGHHDGDHHHHHPGPPPRELSTLWNQAHRLTRWEGAA